MEVLKAGLTGHLFMKQFGQTPTAMAFIIRQWWMRIEYFDRELISENSSNYLFPLF